MAFEELDTYQQIEILIADYRVHRDDERQHTLAIAALFTIFAAVVFAEATQIFHSCSLQSHTCVQIPDVVYAIAPGPAFAVLSFMVMIGTEATLRYGYMRALEHEIQVRIAGLELGGLERPPFSFQRIRLPIFTWQAASLRRFPFPYMFAVMGVVLASVVIALTAFCIAQIDALLPAVVVGVVYGGVGLLILYATALGWGALGWEQGIWEDPGPDLDIGLWALRKPRRDGSGDDPEAGAGRGDGGRGSHRGPLRG